MIDAKVYFFLPLPIKNLVCNIHELKPTVGFIFFVFVLDVNTKKIYFNSDRFEGGNMTIPPPFACFQMLFYNLYYKKKEIEYI